MSTTPTTPMLPQRYHIGTRLGESRVAAVHRADDARLGRTVLFHWLLPHARGSMQHGSNTVRGLLSVYDSGVQDGRAFVITEDVRGQALADQIPLPPDHALAVLRTVTATVTEAEAQGVPYPHVTARNVWLLDHGRVVLLHDWHLSADARARLEAMYRAPEQIQGAATPAGTVYALGVLLREAIGGTTQPNRTPHVSPQLAQLIERATAREPRQRFATLGEFAQALDRYAASMSADTTFMPRGSQPTIAMPMPPMAQAASPPVAPPRQTKVMASPPPPLNVPAEQAPAVKPPPLAQRMRGWSPPRLRMAPWQRGLLRRGSWLAQRVVLIALILIGLNLAYNAVARRAQDIDAAGWIAANTPRIDVEQWLSDRLPNVSLPSVNIGQQAQQQLDSIRDGVADQITSFTAPTTYRVTQSINLRREPSAADNSTVVTRLGAGTRVEQQGAPRPDADGQAYQWIQVKVLDGSGQTGWLALLDDRLEPDQ